MTRSLNKNDLYLLRKGSVICIISKKKVHEMVERELNKPERYKNQKTLLKNQEPL